MQKRYEFTVEGEFIERDVDDIISVLLDLLNHGASS